MGEVFKRVMVACVVVLLMVGVMVTLALIGELFDSLF